MSATGYLIPLAYVLASALTMLVAVAAGFNLAQIGAIAGPVDSESWRFLTASFAYDNVGYLFIVAVALALFGVGIERRLGRFATFVLLFGCGALGAFGGYSIEIALDSGGPLIASGNAVALGAVMSWLMLRRAEVKGAVEQDYDLIGVGVAAAVLLALPLVETSADVFAGLCGGLVGLVAGSIAAKLRPD